MAMLILFIAVANAFAVHTDLWRKPLSNFTNWFQIPFTKSHWNRQPNQPPSDWTNITFNIPDYAVEMQLYTCKNATSGAITEEIEYYEVYELERKVKISFVWWGYPWTCCIGYLYEKTS